MQQDKEKIKKLAQKVMDHGGSGPLAHLSESMDTNEKLDKFMQLFQNLPQIKMAAEIQKLKGDKGDKGEKGEDGQSVDPKQIIKEILKIIRLPKDGNDGAPGKDADEEKIVNKLLKKIPKPKDGESVDFDEVVETVLSMVKIPKPKISLNDVLSLFKNQEGILDFSLLKNVPKLQNIYVHEEGGHAGAMETPIKAGENITISKDASGNWVISADVNTDDFEIQNIFNEYPVDSINSSNTVFNTLNQFSPGTTRVYLNGARQALGIDYTETSSSQITFTSAPLTGSILFIDYELIITPITGDSMLLQDNTNLLLQDSTSLLLQ